MDTEAKRTYLFAVYEGHPRDNNKQSSIALVEHNDHFEIWPGSKSNPEVYRFDEGSTEDERFAIVTTLLDLFLIHPELR